MDNEHKISLPGENLKLLVEGLYEEDIERGNVLCGKQYLTKVCRVFEAEVDILRLQKNQIITKGFICICHIHALIVEVSFRKIVCVYNRGGSQKKICSNQRAIVRLETKEKIAIEKFRDY